MSKNSRQTIYFNGKNFNGYADVAIAIKELLLKYKNADISLRNESIKSFAMLKDYLVKGQNSGIYAEFVKESLAQLLIDLLERYLKFECVELVRSVLSYIITITDNSEPLCEEFNKGGLPSILINTTVNVCSEDFRMKLPKSVSVEDVVAQLILIIHNITRHHRFQQVFIQHENIKVMKDKLIRYLGSKDKRMCILAMAVLTWLAEDDGKDKFLLGLHGSIINDFTEYLNKGMKDKGRWYEGLNVWELLSVLQSLSGMNCIDQSYFCEPKLISTIISIIKSKSSLPEEIEISIGILWNISFTDNSREKLKHEFKVEDAIIGLLHHEKAIIQKKAVDFLYDLRAGQSKAASKKETKFDIFISYCHAQNEIIKNLVNQLKNKYKVWVDTEGIKGCGLNDMADGIEQSKAVMMAVSTSYKQSQCCRSEANWAYRLKKPIIPLLTEYKYKADGWLGMMISTETYIDISNIANINKSLADIEQHLRHKCKDLSVNITVVVANSDQRREEVVAKSSMKALESAETTKEKPVKSWSEGDVLEWFSTNGLAEVGPLLSGFDGRMLESMKKMKESSYDCYHNSVKNELKLTFQQILRLDAAFSNLKI